MVRAGQNIYQAYFSPNYTDPEGTSPCAVLTTTYTGWKWRELIGNGAGARTVPEKPAVVNCKCITCEESASDPEKGEKMQCTGNVRVGVIVEAGKLSARRYRYNHPAATTQAQDFVTSINQDIGHEMWHVKAISDAVKALDEADVNQKCPCESKRACARRALAATIAIRAALATALENAEGHDNIQGTPLPPAGTGMNPPPDFPPGAAVN